MSENSPRASIVDVFENYLGQRIQTTRDGTVGRLTIDQQRELVDLVDVHLRLTSESDLPDDAVLLDSMSDPVLVHDDPTTPMTTRRAKQVALYHGEVMIPMYPQRLEFDMVGPTYLDALLRWSRLHHELLRGHVLTLVGQGPAGRGFTPGDHRDIASGGRDVGQRIPEPSR